MLESVSVTSTADDDRRLNVQAQVATYYRATRAWQLSRAAPSKRPSPLLLALLGLTIVAAVVMKLMGSASPGTPASNPSSPARPAAQARADAPAGKAARSIRPARRAPGSARGRAAVGSGSGTESLPLQAGAAPAGTAAGRKPAGSESERASGAGGPAATATAATDHGEVHRPARSGGWQRGSRCSRIVRRDAGSRRRGKAARWTAGIGS